MEISLLRSKFSKTAKNEVIVEVRLRQCYDVLEGLKFVLKRDQLQIWLKGYKTGTHSVTDSLLVGAHGIEKFK